MPTELILPDELDNELVSAAAIPRTHLVHLQAGGVGLVLTRAQARDLVRDLRRAVTSGSRRGDPAGAGAASRGARGRRIIG